MSTLKLMSLRLRNFKGVRDFTLELDGADATVYGDNAAGKTSIADAWSWLLFGKDSTGASAFEIKTLRRTGDPEHNLEHEVEAEITLPRGERRTLRKVFVEVWSKKRGRAEREFSGHTTNHYVDGVPVKQLEYQATIAEIADESSWRLLTDPLHFAERLHWQDRRKLLLEVCGDVPDSDVIASSKGLGPLVDVLGKRAIDDHRKVIAARRKEINGELDRIPVRISEVERGKPETDGLDEDEIAGSLHDLRKERETAAEQRASLRAGGAAAEKTKELREAEAKLQEIETRAKATHEELLAGLRKQAREAQEGLETTERKAARMAEEIVEASKTVGLTEREMDELREEWHRVDAEAFEHEGETSCPTCGQDLPDEVVAEAHEKALAAFNERKARRLSEIQARGKERKAKRDEREARRVELCNQAEELEAKLERCKEAAEAAQEALDRAAEKGDTWRETDAWKDAEMVRAKLARQLADIEAAGAPKLEEIDAEVLRLDTAIAESEAKLSRFEQARKADARIDELKAEEKKLSAEFERLEHELWMCDEFVRSKVELLEERINARFRMANFRLFRSLVHGGLEEACDVTYKGVPWNSLNHGARIQVGLDVINTLHEHFGIAVPVFVDQGESVTSLPEMSCQLIRLVVSEADKKLRVELVEKEQAVAV